jgi:hypothetical protein
MKKVFAIASLILLMLSCKKTEEVKVDQTVIDTPVDSIVQNDTVAVSSTEEIISTDVSTTEVPVLADNSKKASYAAFGRKIEDDKAITKEEMLIKYRSMKAGDTISVKFRSKIKNVCKKKGCWMAMELPDNKESFVKFKDYAFFVPLNADNSEAVIAGKAYIDVVSVAELQHYAKDGGESKEEIEKITEPKITYAFQADGVLIKE